MEIGSPPPFIVNRNESKPPPMMSSGTIPPSTMPTNDAPKPVMCPPPVSMATPPPPNNGSRGQFFSSSTLPSSMKLLGIFLRAMPIILAFIAATVMGAASLKLGVWEYFSTIKSGYYESVTWPYLHPDTKPPEQDHSPPPPYWWGPTLTIKAVHFSALSYFVAANVLAAVYSIFSLAMSLVNKAGSSKLEMLISVGDMVIVVLLFTGNAAASAISVALDQGYDRLLWPGVCKFLGHFCPQIKAAIALSMIASFAYFLLVIVTIFGLYKRSSS